MTFSSRYLNGMCAEELVRPVVLMETYWVREVLREELDRRRGSLSRVEGLIRALTRVEAVPFCLLEGNHRSLAAALLDRHVISVVIRTPGELDAWRRHDRQFPHETEQDLRELGRKWVDARFGSVEQAAFDTDPLTVFERAELIESAGRLPREAREILDEVRGSG